MPPEDEDRFQLIIGIGVPLPTNTTLNKLHISAGDGAAATITVWQRFDDILLSLRFEYPSDYVDLYRFAYLVEKILERDEEYIQIIVKAITRVSRELGIDVADEEEGWCEVQLVLDEDTGEIIPGQRLISPYWRYIETDPPKLQYHWPNLYGPGEQPTRIESPVRDWLHFLYEDRSYHNDR